MRLPARLLSSIVVLFALLLMQGCGPSARMDALRPAAVPLPGVRALVVADFVGPYGEDARRCFRERLAESQRFSVAFGTDGSLPGVAVVRAEVSSGLHDRRGEENQNFHDTISRVVTERDGQGNVIRTYTEEVPVRRVRRLVYVDRSARVEARLRVESGSRLLAEESDSESLERRYGGVDCDDKDSERYDDCLPLRQMPRECEVLSELACSVGAELARRILPEAYTVHVALDEDGGELVRQGAELADDDSWAAAVSLWRQALAANPGNAPALYNLGVEQERRGTADNLRQAQSYYSRAFGLDPKRLYAEGMERIAGRIRDAEELARRLEGVR
jgi:tetratricopeptide (TPR) repeat protein